MPSGHPQHPGINALARKLGISTSMAQRYRAKGMTDGQIEAKVAERQNKIRAGIKVVGPIPAYLQPDHARARAGQPTFCPPGQEKVLPEVEGSGRPGSTLLDRLRAAARASRAGVTVPVPTPDPEPPIFTYTDVPVPPDSVENMAAAQLRKESALADLKETELAQRRGLLVPIGVVNAWFADVIVKSRNMLLRIGPENGDRLAVETSPAACAKMVTDEVVKALAVLREMDTPNL